MRASRDHAQGDLFFAPVIESERWSPDSRETHEGWERRLLADLADGPMVCCYPGFTGAICERLVAKGLVTREDAGFMPRPEFWPPKRRYTDKHPQFRYALARAA